MLGEPLAITRSVETESGGMRAILAVADYATGFNLRAACICLERTPDIIPQFAGFPGEPHPVQLYLAHNGNKTTFPPVLRGPRRAGFHSPQLSSPAIMNEFPSLPFKPGALISNGCRGVFLALPDRGQSASNLISDC